MSNPEKLTADEIALYDRQIRLWGTDTQLRLRLAKLLVIRLGGIGTETVKNLVLGGINSIEILDDSVVKEEDFASQFVLPNDDSIIGQQKLPHVISKIKELNTRVHLLTSTRSLKETDLEYFKSFDLVLATELDKQELLRVNDITRSLNIPLYVAGLHGLFGYILADLIKHESVKTFDRGNQARSEGTAINGVKTITRAELVEKESKERVTITDAYVPLKEIFSSTKLTAQLNKRQLRRLSGALPLILSLFEISRPEPENLVDILLLKQVLRQICERYKLPESTVSEEYLREFANQAYTEFAPSAAILGGILAQDVIQYFGQKDSPINNCLIFDSIRAEVPIFYL
ncbi:hypothetical protein HF325_002328 [Metschnikowia pulcherrima]|uniref:Ubiquitin-like 1-activating enzyme E1A n=1 Tax=Metschnikowia pulcherrima TaxID=27326 RepID=A0A8H7GWM5_9ASCO|nr:hypothetical protein HF325_002328 [Metschnikowia pulcherrima]